MGQLLHFQPHQGHRLHRCRQSNSYAAAASLSLGLQKAERSHLEDQTHSKTYFNKRLYVNRESPVWVLFFFPALVHKRSRAKSSPWGQLLADVVCPPRAFSDTCWVSFCPNTEMLVGFYVLGIEVRAAATVWGNWARGLGSRCPVALVTPCLNCKPDRTSKLHL